MTSVREQVLDEAIQLVTAMTSLCLKYQSYLRTPDYSSSGDNLHARLELADECNDKFRVPPSFIFRRLEVAGYQQLAESLRSLSAMVRRFSLLTISWDPEQDLVLLDDDVETPGNQLLANLEAARRGTETFVSSQPLTDEELKTLLAAGDLIGHLATNVDDYLFYFEGLQDAHEDDEISNADRMAAIRASTERLDTTEVIDQCTAKGYGDLASAIGELSAAVSSTLTLEQPATSPTPEDLDRLSAGIRDRYEKVTELLLRHSRHKRGQATP